MAVIAQADVSVVSICAGGAHVKMRVVANGNAKNVDVEIDRAPTAADAVEAVATLMLYAASKLPTRAQKRALLQSGRVTVEDV